jgi:hypothetical protein
VRATLDGPARQARQPAEPVVGDGGPIDATIDIFTQFAQAASFAVLVHRNQTRLGPAGNFFQAPRLCNQVEIWRPAKLATVHAAIDRCLPDVLLRRYATLRRDARALLAARSMT